MARSFPSELWIGFKFETALPRKVQRVGVWTKPFESNSYGEQIISRTKDVIIYSAGSSVAHLGRGVYAAKRNWRFALVRYTFGGKK